MNLDKLQKKLFAAARANPPSDRVPYAFEKRILARLAARRVEDARSQWGAALWRGAAACVAVTVLLSVWSFSGLNRPRSGANLSQDLEHTLLASGDEVDNNW